MKLTSALAAAVVFAAASMQAPAQTVGDPPEAQAPQTSTISVRSNLVLVPALVKTKSGELVFALTADDFILTDNGVPQPLRLEPDTDQQPVALAIIVQTGGHGASHLGDYRDLDAVLDAVVGNVEHRIAVVTHAAV